MTIRFLNDSDLLLPRIKIPVYVLCLEGWNLLT